MPLGPISIAVLVIVILIAGYAVLSRR